MILSMLSLLNIPISSAAFIAMTYTVIYLRSYLAATDECHGCGHTHKNGEVEYGCRKCRSAFYCSRACQVKSHRGEMSNFMKHKLLCPLVKSRKKICKANPDVQHMTSEEVVSTIESNSRFKLFVNYFMSF